MTLTRRDHNHDCPCATDAVEHGSDCADCDCGAVDRYKKRKRQEKTKTKIVKRWALWNPYFGIYRPLPHRTEVLFDSRRSAIAAKLSGSHYEYDPIKVELHVTQERRTDGR